MPAFGAFAVTSTRNHCLNIIEILFLLLFVSISCIFNTNITHLSLMDKINTQTLLTNVNMLSVNQLNAQIKINDVWKAVHDSSHPLKIEKIHHASTSFLTRAEAKGDLKEFGKTVIVQSTFLSDACHIWNKCPKDIKECDTLWKAKKAIRKYVASLPI